MNFTQTIFKILLDIVRVCDIIETDKQNSGGLTRRAQMKLIDMEKQLAFTYEQIYRRYIECKDKSSRSIRDRGYDGYYDQRAHGLWLSLTIIEINFKLGCNYNVATWIKGGNDVLAKIMRGV